MITNIVAKNFQSWKLLNFSIPKGITLVDGWNHDDQTSEGSGKSAILNALSWGLYGRMPKDSKIDEVIKDGTKSCEVSIYLDHPVIQYIHRSRNPNKTVLVDINNHIRVGKDVKETQAFIDELLGMSFDTFCQTIYFAQNHNKKFITATQEERGKILSEIQDLELFDKARKEVQNLLKISDAKNFEYTKDLEIRQVKFDYNKRFIQQQIENEKNQRKALIESFQKQIESKIIEVERLKRELLSYNKIDIDMVSIEKDIENLEKELNNTQNHVNTLKNERSNIEKNNQNIRKLKIELGKYQYETEKLLKKRRELVDYTQTPDQACPTCGSQFNDSQEEHVAKAIAQIEKEVFEKGEYATSLEEELSCLNLSNDEDLNSQLKESTDLLINISSIIRDLRAKYNEKVKEEINLHSLKERLDSRLKDIDSLTLDIETLTNTPSMIDQNVIGVLEEENSMIFNDIAAFKKLIDDNRIYSSQLENLKDGFREVKSYTFNSVLNELTTKTNRYLSDLFEVPINIKFKNEDMKIDTEIVIDGNLRGFGLLSGGQQRRLSLAIDLALSDIVVTRTGSSFNLRILDEYFRDLSEQSMIKCLRLLEKLKGPTILVEHNSIFKSIVNNVFKIELENGTSRMVNE